MRPESPLLRRSALFVPGANRRALARARTVDADVLIFDLEDSAAPAVKAAARRQVCEAVRAGGYAGRELAVRVNAVDSAEWSADVQAAAALPVHALLLPKVHSAAAVAATVQAVESTAQAEAPALWVMVESAAALMALAEITAAAGRASCLVVGTEDLAVDMAVPPTPARLGLLAALSQCVAAARARGLGVLDGVHAELNDAAGLARMCEQGRSLGFDGKTLVHPSQVEVANRVFRPTEAEVAAAETVVAAWESRAAGCDVIAVDGRMVERLHVTAARRVVAVKAEAEMKDAAAARPSPPLE